MHNNTLNMLSDRLCKDMEESMHDEKITPATMEMLYRAVDIIKDIETINAMKEYGEDYSEGYPMKRSYGHYDSYGSSYRNNDISRRMEHMSERDRQRVEDFMRQM